MKNDYISRVFSKNADANQKNEAEAIPDNLSLSSGLSLKQKLSNKYKEENLKSSHYSKNQNNGTNEDLLFYQREKELIEKIQNMEDKNSKTEEAIGIMNDFFFEVQKLVGIEKPQYLLGDIDNIDNDKLIKHLQNFYKVIYKRTQNSEKYSFRNYFLNLKY